MQHLQNCIVANNTSQTHTWFASPDGFIKLLYMSSETMNLVYEDLFKLIKKKKTNESWNSITEKIIADKPFRFFIDLDWNIDQVKNNTNLRQNIIDIVQLLKTDVESFVKMDNLNMIIARRLDYKLHIHFPELIVKKDTAILIKKHLENVLKKQKPDYYSKGVLDQSVYSTGIRMIWCHKGVMIKKKKNVVDPKIIHELIYGIGSYQDIYKVVDPVTFNDLSFNKNQLNDTSILTLESENFVVETVVGVVASKKQRLTSTVNSLNVGNGSVNNDDTGNTDNTDKERAIREFVETNYIGVISQVIFKNDLKSIIVPLDIGYCPFKRGSHSGNTRQYIVINKNGACQCCYSEKLDVCKNGKFSHIAFDKLPKEIKNAVNEMSHELTIVNKTDVFDEIIKSFQAENYPEFKEMNWKMGPLIETPYGHRADLIENCFCPMCKIGHPSPENYLLVTENGKKMIGCNKKLDAWFPDPAAQVSVNQYNVLYQNVTNNYYNNTVINNGTIELSGNVKDDAISEILNDNFGFYDIHSHNIDFKRALHGSHSAVASFLKTIISNSCVADEKGQLWTFDNGFWNDNLGENCLRNQLIDIKVVLDIARRFYTENEIISKLIDTLKENVLNNQFQNNVITIFKHSGHIEMSFSRLLDQNPMLLPFNNGCFDFNEKRFRPLTPDDRCSISVGYNYSEIIDSTLENQIMIMFGQIFPVKELCDYMTLFLGSCLVGIKKEDGRFNIGYGSGANGKTIIQKIMAYVLGPYAGTVASSLFTAKSTNPDAPTPGLVSMINKRFIYMSETEKGTQFNEALVKLLTGGDEIAVRAMYQESTTMKPQFKILMVANDLPKFRGEEYSMQRRLAVIPFLSQFVDIVPLNGTENVFYFQKNPQLDEWIKKPEVIQSICKILINQCLIYLQSETTAVPEIIKKHTLEYIHHNDDVEMFYAACFEPSDIPNDYDIDVNLRRFTVSENIDHFTVYLTSVNKSPGNTLSSKHYPSKLKFSELVSKKIDKTTHKVMYGKKCICKHVYNRVI